jgi:hypothetical protein
MLSIPESANIISQLATKYSLLNTKVVIATKQNPYNGNLPNAEYADASTLSSVLGTPVFAPLTMGINLSFNNKAPLPSSPPYGSAQTIASQPGGQYTDHITKRVYTVPTLTFQCVLINVTQTKKIVKTQIQGRDNSVKEYIGQDDYHITINGIINGANGQRPTQDIINLKKLLDAPIPVDVVSDYLRLLGIYTIVVEGYTFDQEAGGYSKQNFTINAISDTPTILQFITP